MRIKWFLSFMGVYLVDNHFAGCVCNLHSIKLEAFPGTLRTCHKCLLRIGATRVEAKGSTYREVNYRGLIEAMEYEVWGSEFFLTDLIACVQRHICKQDYLGLIPPPDATDANKMNELVTISPNEEGISMSEALLPVQHTTKTHSPLCLHRINQYTTPLCEACIRQHSETGDMGKYFIKFSTHHFVMYIINTSDPEVVKKSCNIPEICEGNTALLLGELCNLFLNRVSPSISATETTTDFPSIAESLSYWPREHAKYFRDDAETIYENLEFAGVCYRTEKAYELGQVCWKCLADKSEGFVILDRDERFIVDSTRKRNSYRVLVMGKKGLDTTKCPECGEITKTSGCMSDGVHLRATHSNESPISSRNCVLARTIPTRKEDCYKCLEPFGDVSHMSQSTLLISIWMFKWSFTDVWSKCFTKDESPCITVSLLPMVMCYYQVHKSYRQNFDVNLPADSVLSDQHSPTDESDLGEKVVHLKFDENYSKNCLEWLLLHRKVVVISAYDGYLWMVKPTDSIVHKCEVKFEKDSEYFHRGYFQQISQADQTDYRWMQRKIRFEQVENRRDAKRRRISGAKGKSL